MIDTGLSDREIAAVCSVLARHRKVERAVLFGSRAKGTARNASDLDLAVTGTADDRDVEALILDLDELPLPYKFDVKDLARIHHPSLLSHIARVAKPIYERDRS